MTFQRGNNQNQPWGSGDPYILETPREFNARGVSTPYKIGPRIYCFGSGNQSGTEPGQRRTQNQRDGFGHTLLTRCGRRSDARSIEDLRSLGKGPGGGLQKSGGFGVVHTRCSRRRVINIPQKRRVLSKSWARADFTEDSPRQGHL